MRKEADETALFACVGVQVAGGEAGMNLIGCTLVGCVAGLGGGTVNSLLYGAARDGVSWARRPSFLVVAVGASIATFVLWPMYVQRKGEVGAVVKMEFDNSDVVYAMDTVALAAVSIVAANGSVGRGLHPVVAVASGITICFGGIGRDVLCGRPLAIGAQLRLPFFSANNVAKSLESIGLYSGDFFRFLPIRNIKDFFKLKILMRSVKQ